MVLHLELNSLWLELVMSAVSLLRAFHTIHVSGLRQEAPRGELVFRRIRP